MLSLDKIIEQATADAPYLDSITTKFVAASSWLTKPNSAPPSGSDWFERKPFFGKMKSDKKDQSSPLDLKKEDCMDRSEGTGQLLVLHSTPLKNAL